jgi:hypothetical protein
MHVTGILESARRAALVTLAAAAGVTAWTAPGLAATAHVHYVSNQNVYVDAGKANGLEEAATLWVVRDGKRYAQLQAEFVAQHSAACKLLTADVVVRPGDSVEYEAARAAEAAPVPLADAAAPRADAADSPWFADVGGQVVTTYTVSTQTEGTYENPGILAELRWGGQRRDEVKLRLRGERPTFRPTGVVNTAQVEVRIAEVAVRYRSAGQRLEAAGGRFVPLRLETLGTLDGAAIGWSPAARWRLGIAAGRLADAAANTRPDPVSRLGGFVETTWGGSERTLSLHVAVAHEQEGPTARRQYVLLRSDARAGSMRFYQRWEIDLSPGWKRSAGYPAVDLTGLTAGAEWTRPRATILLGIDTRQPVLGPELLDVADQTGFQRQVGVNGSIRLRLSDVRFMRLGADVRRGLETQENTYGWNASLAQQRLWSPRLAARLQASGFESVSTRGVYASGGLDVGIGRRTRWGVVSGATWSEHRSTLSEPTEPDVHGWVRGSLAYQTSAGWWFDASAEWRSARVADLALQVGRVF